MGLALQIQLSQEPPRKIEGILMPVGQSDVNEVVENLLNSPVVSWADTGLDYGADMPDSAE